jgi:uncharacterized heparinase superfamily protein
MNIRLLPFYFHTISRLRADQILARLLRQARLQLQIPPVSITSGLTEHLSCVPLRVRVPFLRYSQFDSEDIERRRFRFLNESYQPCCRMDWRQEKSSRLWRYNLHYFQYLQTLDGIYPLSGLLLIRDWIEQNPAGTPDSWDPFPISLRLVNWIKYLSRIDLPLSGLQPLLPSVYQQALWLEHSLEYHLMGNHLFKNAKALVFCGIFFRGRDADRWLSKGIRLLNKELGEQILPDGGHFERSPLYHSMVLEDCLDLLNVCEHSTDHRLILLSHRLRKLLPEMMGFLVGMTHPDCQIALFNDAVFGIEAAPGDLRTYYEKLTGKEVPSPSGLAWSFPVTGYFIMSPRTGERLFIDCGPVGPDHQPGHSHCDTLSFELSLGGMRVVVDSGCFQYDDGEMRRYNRGNYGHNTVTIDGRNQSEVWGAHRCARRAHPIYARLNVNADGTIVFEGAHDGYRRLRGEPVHHRRVVSAARSYLIEDSVEGGGTHEIVSRLHIHPEVNVDLKENKAEIFCRSRLLATVSLCGPGRIEKRSGWYSPEFGLKKACVVLESCGMTPLPYRGGWLIRVG